MEIKNKNIFLNLNEGEEIVYVADKNKGEFYCFALIHFFGALFFFFFLIASFFTTLESAWLIYVLFFILIFFLYLYIRDYFFTETILTNQRLIISRFNKLTLTNFKQIKNIWSLPITANAPTATNISMQPKTRYRIYFINEQKLRNQLKELYPEYNYTGITVTWKAPWWQWVLCIAFLIGIFFMVIHFHQ